MKRILAVGVILIVCAAALLPLQGAVFAETEIHDLPEDYLAEIAYCNYYLANGGVARIISVTFDKDFYSNPNNHIAYIYVASAFVEIFERIGYEAEYTEGGKIEGIVYYDSVTDLYLANDIDGYDNSTSDVEAKKSLFFVDYTSRQKTVFEDVKSNESSIFYYLLNSLNALGIDSDAVLLTYSYGTPYKMITSNAENSSYDSQQRIYVHDFYMSVNGSGRTIEIYQHVPNSFVWYSLALGGSIIIGLLFLLVHVAKRKGR